MCGIDPREIAKTETPKIQNWKNMNVISSRTEF